MRRTPRSIAFGFVLLCLAAAVGFWRPYLSQLGAPATPWLHLHAASVGSWLLLLVAQPLLVASGQLGAHRAIGTLSWGLAPMIVVTSVALAVTMTRPQGGAGLEEFRYALFFVHIASALLFTLSSALALAWRRERVLHVRLMLCSGLFFIDPVFARVFMHGTPDAPWLVAHGSVLLSLLAFAALVWADRRAAHGRWVFASFGVLDGVMHGTALVIDRWAPWRWAMQGWFGP